MAGFDLRNAREAVVFAVDCWDEVHDERSDVADVDESDDPLEDGGAVVVLLVAHNAEC